MRSSFLSDAYLWNRARILTFVSCWVDNLLDWGLTKELTIRQDCHSSSEGTLDLSAAWSWALMGVLVCCWSCCLKFWPGFGTCFRDLDEIAEEFISEKISRARNPETSQVGDTFLDDLVSSVAQVVYHGTQVSEVASSNLYSISS